MVVWAGYDAPDDEDDEEAAEDDEDEPIVLLVLIVFTDSVVLVSRNLAAGDLTAV